MPTQHVLPCTEAFELGLDPMAHNSADCAAIVMEEDDGRITSISHKDNADPATRLNIDVPAEDWR